MAVACAKCAFVDITASETVARKARDTSTGERSQDIGTRGIWMTVAPSSRRTFVDIGAGGADAREARLAGAGVRANQI